MNKVFRLTMFDAAGRSTQFHIIPDSSFGGTAAEVINVHDAFCKLEWINFDDISGARVHLNFNAYASWALGYVDHIL